MEIGRISVSSNATFEVAKSRTSANSVAPNGSPNSPTTADSNVQLEKDKAKQLSEADAAQLAKLQARDRAVRQHEMAHLAVSGGLATSGASFTYQKGPDGVDYAVGGEVSIDTSPGRTPEDTIARARQIQAAALAPADPSGQDRAVASQAAQMEIAARAELAATAGADTTSANVTNSNSNKASNPASGASEASINLLANQMRRAYGEPQQKSSINVVV